MRWFVIFESLKACNSDQLIQWNAMFADFNQM